MKKGQKKAARSEKEGNSQPTPNQSSELLLAQVKELTAAVNELASRFPRPLQVQARPRRKRNYVAKS